MRSKSFSTTTMVELAALGSVGVAIALWYHGRQQAKPAFDLPAVPAPFDALTKNPMLMVGGAIGLIAIVYLYKRHAAQQAATAAAAAEPKKLQEVIVKSAE